jgi:hypothetical protein
VSTRGLSCYTAALFRYLDVEWDAAALVARSVRLAVRTDLADGRLAFSHHEPALDLLPDGSRLRYAAACGPAAALPELAGELARHGRVVIVADSARLPWSVVRGSRPAPHWLLVDGRRADGWHVVDSFAAQLPAGEQLPHCGWLSTAGLSDAMRLPPSWAPEQELRNVLAFGSPVSIPRGGALWLRRSREPAGPAAGESGRWLCGDAGALPFLISYLTDPGAGAARHLDDIWAAAGHRSFAYRWQLAADPGDRDRRALGEALSRWEKLPQLLRLAVESAGRGRPRPTLVRTALEALLRAEEVLR